MRRKIEIMFVTTEGDFLSSRVLPLLVLLLYFFYLFNTRKIIFTVLHLTCKGDQFNITVFSGTFTKVTCPVYTSLYSLEPFCKYYDKIVLVVKTDLG